MSDALYEIHGTRPVAVRTITSDQGVRAEQVSQYLMDGRPCQVVQDVPRLLQAISLSVGDVAALSICKKSELVPVHGTSISPIKTTRTEVYLLQRWKLEPGALASSLCESPELGAVPRAWIEPWSVCLDRDPPNCGMPQA